MSFDNNIEIKNYRQEVLNSASLDLEWVSYKGEYQHSKTKIFAAAFWYELGREDCSVYFKV